MRKIVHLLCAILLVVLLTATTAMAVDEREVRIYVDGTQVEFSDAKPYIDSNYRTMVPVRFPAEAIGAEVYWNNDSETVTAIKGDRSVELSVGSKEYYVNGVKHVMDTEMVYNRQQFRNYVPIRFVLEGLGAEVDWGRDENDILIYVFTTDDRQMPALNPISIPDPDFDSKPDPPSPKIVVDKSIFTVKGLSIGNLQTDVTTIIGTPNRIEPSIYNFDWHVYNQDYSEFIQVGIRNGKVVSLLNVIELENYNRKFMRQELGKPLSYILINNTQYMQSSNEYDVFLVDNTYVYAYYDLHENDEVIAIVLLEKTSRESLDGFLPRPSDKLKKVLSKQIFDLANAMRVSKGLHTLQWDDQVAITGEKHSMDMAKYNYFAHTNLLGQSPFDRMRNDGIQFKSAAENLAAGQPDAITAHVGWMNSLGHRKALLSDQQYLGVGTAYGGNYGVFYTQMFFSR